MAEFELVENDFENAMMQTAMTQFDANQQAGMNLMNSFAAEAGPIFLELGCEQKCVNKAMTRARNVKRAL